MKLLVTILCFFFVNAPAHTRDFGLGVILGDPTGVSAKGYLNKVNAIDAAVAWSFGDHDAIHLHGDYLWHRPRAFVVEGENVGWYYGVGARIIMWDKDRHRDYHGHDDGWAVGPRFPIGLNYTFRDPRIEFFGEAALVMDLVPGTDVDLDLGIGARFYF